MRRLSLGTGVKRESRSRGVAARRRPAPTLADVASYAGVAAMTVSRVINGASNVRHEKREAVHAAIKKLNYSPNLAARALAGARQVRIGMLYGTLGASFLSELLVGSLAQASLSHAQLIVEKADETKDEDDVVRDLLETGVDGILLPPPLCDSKRIQAAILEQGAAAVTIASAAPPQGLSSVRIDDCAAAAAMTRHLLALGHKRIGFVLGNPQQSASAMRCEGYKLALREAGIPLETALIQKGMFTYRSGLKAAERLLASACRPSAIFASNDDMAAAAIAVAHRHHIEVPKELTICGFDDTELSRCMWPELTTIRQPIADMSRAAVSLLIKKVLERRKGLTTGSESILLGFTLVRRDSDGPPDK